jgi:hypothetical protein
VTRAGTVVIADTLNCRVRKVALGSGTISTYAGTGLTGYNADGFAARKTTFNSPVAVSVSPSGVVYVGDDSANRVRKIH